MIEIAQYSADKLPLSEGEHTDGALEYSCAPPFLWSYASESNFCLRFIGWAVSLDRSPARLTISDMGAIKQIIRPVRSRPDVARHYARKGFVIDECCGFDVIVPVLVNDSYENQITLEISNKRYRSGPLNCAAREIGPRLIQSQLSNQPTSRGRLDNIDGRRVTGWAQQVATDKPATVLLCINGIEVAEQLANRFREDLKTMRISESGENAFEFEVSAELKAGDEIRVIVASDRSELKNSPQTLQLKS